MEHGTHDIVVMAGQHTDASTRLPVPHANGLIIAGTDDPGILCVELHCSDIVQVAQQREQTASQLVVPDFDLVIIASRYKQGLRLVKVDTANWAIMLVKSVDERAHAVVPKLQCRMGGLVE